MSPSTAAPTGDAAEHAAGAASASRRPTGGDYALVLVVLVANLVLVGTSWGMGVGVVLFLALSIGYALLVRERGSRARGESVPADANGLRADLTRARQALDASQAELRARARESEELDGERQSAQASNRSKSEFLASMSHEIRTPMNGIIGMAELLLETSLSSEQKDYCRTIVGSAKGLLTILNDILDFSKIEADKLELEAAPFDLVECVEGVIELLHPKACEKGLELTCWIDPALPVSLVGDSTRLRQVLINLVGNAIKFTAQGHVEVVVQPQPGAPEGEGSLELRVSDTGIGIPSDRRDRLFQPFSQLDRSTAREYGGTGLGLAISAQLVHAMGGEIGVESVEGAGSSFWLRVRLRPAPGEQRSVPVLPRSRILLVDASQASRRVVRRYLEPWGMEITEAGTAEEALEAARRAVERELPFHVALIDLRLSGLGGKELAMQLKADQRTRPTHLVLLKGPAANERTSSLVRCGFEAWISKPVNAGRLRTALEHVLEESHEESHEEHAALLPAREPSTDGGAHVMLATHMVLLVEDNLVNQKVASLVLRRLGCAVDIAGSGEEAVRTAGDKRYDVIFMDCQLPLMSGFEAAGRIRKLPDQVKAAVPIVAMTASAMPGDSTRCIEAGMNDYLSKPVQKAELKRILDRWAASPVGDPGVIPPEGKMNERDDAVLDPMVIESLKELGGEDDPGLFNELVQLFLEDTPARIRELGNALLQSDAQGIEQAAHALKSSAANLGAIQLSKVFLEIEAAGREHDLGRAKSLVEQSNAAYERVRRALSAEVG